MLMNDTCAAIEIYWFYPPQPVTVASEGLWGSLTKDIKMLVVTVTEWGAYPRYIYISLIPWYVNHPNMFGLMNCNSVPRQL